MKTLELVLFCMVMCGAKSCLNQEPCTFSPILFIPGIPDSKLNVRDDSSFPCSTFGMYTKLWFSTTRLLVLQKCALREAKLVYDETTDTFQDHKDVTIQVPGFGGTDGLRTGVLDSFIEYFVERGYVEGESIRTAPYDWRLAADELEKRDYYKNLKTLIEEMYKENGQKKVTLVAHSMGGPVSLHFLTGYSGIDQNWKDTHINAWVTLSGAWSGSVGALDLLMSGYHTPLPDFVHDMIGNFVSIAQTLESIPWMLPSSSVFGNTVLVSTPSRDYTADDYEKLFSDIGYTNGFTTYQRVLGINVDFPAPNVPTYCYYGVNVDTPAKLTFETDLNNTNTVPSVEFGDGDGSVNIESAEVCRKWSTMSSKYPFTYRKYNEVEHGDMLANDRVLADIASIVRALPPTSHMSM